MRIVPLITAIVVTSVLFLLIMERDRLMAFAIGDPNAVPEQAAEPEVAEEAVGTLSTPLQKVVVRHSEAQEIDGAVVLRGETESARQVDVRAETTGLVVSEPLRKGAFVEAGQVMCELDPGTRPAVLAQAQAGLANAQASVPQAQALLKQALAGLDEAKINDKVARELSKTGYASETRVAGTQAGVSAAEAGVETARSGLEAAQAAISSALANVASAEKEIERLTIHAPFSGLLETDTAELGSLVSAGAVCGTIIQLDPIKFVGYVPETEVHRVNLGSLAGARLTDGREVAGRVTFLSRSADPQTRTFRVDIDVANADLSILDGQTAEILIASTGTLAHLLPQSALTLNDGGDLGVRVVDTDNRVMFKPVTLLRDTIDGVWLAGLEMEEEVIVIGQEFVIAGVEVEPTYAEAAQ